jgi:hypothetical protein
MANIFPDNYPKRGWESQFDVEAARKDLPHTEDLVPHPRYGKAPALHGVEFSQAASFGIYQFRPAWTFPATRIRADESKQNYSDFPKSEYLDVLCQCRDCRRWFIFFAKEQQYWFEELRFYIDSICVHCSECRSKRRQYHREEQEFASLHREPQPNAEQIARLLELTIKLWNRQYITKRSQLDSIIRQVSKHDPTHLMLEAVRTLRRRFDAARSNINQ